MPEKRTLFEKVWDEHVVPLLQTVCRFSTSTCTWFMRSLRPRRSTACEWPDAKCASPIGRSPPSITIFPPSRAALPSPIRSPPARFEALQKNCKEFGVPLFDMDSPDQGIVHVIGPELGLTQPGMTIVCGDSHTSTHGAFGALAFGIGTSEVEHVLATQCLPQRKPKTMLIDVRGSLAEGVTAKDLALGIIGQIGTDGATGHVIEYAGEAVRALSMEGRMTLCNMSIEAGARAGMVAPDETTFAYIKGRRFAPKNGDWENDAGTLAQPAFRSRRALRQSRRN